MNIRKYLIPFYAVISYFSIQQPDATMMESDATRINFDVTVIEPTCHFTYTNKVDFGEVDKVMIKNALLWQPISLKFIDCSADSVEIRFTGQHVDYNNNYITNSTGPEFAQGVAIKLLEINKEEVSLIQPYIIHNAVKGENTANDISLVAQLIPTASNKAIMPGEIKTSFELSVTYK